MNLSEYPAAIEAARLNLQHLTQAADRAREDAGAIEDAITASVAAAKDENGKPLHSNETARKAAIAAALKSSGAYQTQIALLADAEAVRVKAEARLERLRGEFAVMKIERNEAFAGRLAACAVG